MMMMLTLIELSLSLSLIFLDSVIVLHNILQNNNINNKNNKTNYNKNRAYTIANSEIEVKAFIYYTRNIEKFSFYHHHTANKHSTAQYSTVYSESISKSIEHNIYFQFFTSLYSV